MASPVRIGTRKSPLAQWQATWVADKLQAYGLDCELVLIETKGDRMLHLGIPEIGSKGVFTEDIELQLAAGHIHLAVHSAKDMPSELPEGYELIAFTVREQAHDVVVSHEPVDLNGTPTLGTSSTRRVAFMKHYFPQVTTVGVRGNLQTRISKLEPGNMDALVLAYAGVHRMGMNHLIVQELPLHQFVPAVGQGSMAIEVSSKLSEEQKILFRDLLNDGPTHREITAERAFLKTLQGGCSIPAFAHATLNERILNLQGGIISLDGSKKIEFTFQADYEDGERLGQNLATKVLEAGGEDILSEIRREMK